MIAASPQDVLAFWRDGRARQMVQQGRRVRRRHPRALSCDLRSRGGRQAVGLGSRPPKARSRWSSCSTSSRATCSAASARAFAADPLARAVAERALARGFDQRRSPARSGSSSICRSSIPRRWPTRSAAARCSRATGDADLLKWAELHADIIRRFGRFPHRNARARPRHHAGGAGVPRRRRLRRLGQADRRRRPRHWTLPQKRPLIAGGVCRRIAHVVAGSKPFAVAC